MGTESNADNYKHFYWANSVPYFSQHNNHHVERQRADMPTTNRSNSSQIEPTNVITTKLDSQNKPHYYLNISSDPRSSGSNFRRSNVLPSYISGEKAASQRESYVAPLLAPPEDHCPTATTSQSRLVYDHIYSERTRRNHRPYKREKRRRRERYTPITDNNMRTVNSIGKRSKAIKRLNGSCSGLSGSATRKNQLRKFSDHAKLDNRRHRTPCLYPNNSGSAGGHNPSSVLHPDWNWTLNWIRSINGTPDPAGQGRHWRRGQETSRKMAHRYQNGGLNNEGEHQRGLRRTYLTGQTSGGSYLGSVLQNGNVRTSYSPQLERLKYLNLAYTKIEGVSLRIKVISTIFLVCGCLMLICDIAHIMLSWPGSHSRLHHETELLYSLYTLLLSILGLSTVKKNSSVCHVFVIFLAFFIAAHLLVPFALPIPKRIMEIIESFTSRQRNQPVVHAINDNISVATLPSPEASKTLSIESSQNLGKMVTSKLFKDGSSLKTGIATFLLIHLILSIIIFINGILGLVFGIKLLKLI